MANTISTYSDSQIMKALLTRDFSGIGSEFIDDVVTEVKAGGFTAAENLNKVSLPALKTVHAAAFQNTDITTLDLPWEQLEAIGYGAFLGASGLPQTLTLTNVKNISNAAFAGTSSARNTQLRTVSLPNWTGSSFTETGLNGSSGSGIFAYCSALTSFSAPELQSVPSNMFNNCAGLTELRLPKVTSLGGSCFYYCTNLKTLELGGAISRLSASNISYCNALEALILSGVTSVPTASSSFFSNTTISKKTGYIYVPKALEDTFKVASYWSTYASQIRAIEDYPDICGS